MSQNLTGSAQDTVSLLRWHVAIVLFPTSLLFCQFADQLASTMLSVTRSGICHSFTGYDRGKH